MAERREEARVPEEVVVVVVAVQQQRPGGCGGHTRRCLNGLQLHGQIGYTIVVGQKPIQRVLPASDGVKLGGDTTGLKASAAASAVAATGRIVVVAEVSCSDTRGLEPVAEAAEAVAEAPPTCGISAISDHHPRCGLEG